MKREGPTTLRSTAGQGSGVPGQLDQVAFPDLEHFHQLPGGLPVQIRIGEAPPWVGRQHRPRAALGGDLAHLGVKGPELPLHVGMAHGLPGLPTYLLDPQFPQSFRETTTVPRRSRQDFMDGLASLFPRLVDQGRMVPQAVAQFRVARHLLIQPRWRGELSLVPLTQALDDAHFLGRVAVQFQAEGPQPQPRHPLGHHIQRRHLLGDKEHRLPPVQRGGYQVGDGLGLSRPGRSLDHEVLAIQGIYQGGVLGAVRHIHEGVILMDICQLVDGVLRLGRVKGGLIIFRLPGLGPARDDRPHQRMSGEGPVLRPVRRVQIAIHQQPAEVQHGDGGPTPHLPVGELFLDLFGDIGEVGLRPDVLGQLRQYEAVLLLQLRRQGGIELNLFRIQGQGVLIGAGSPVDRSLLHPDGNDVERGVVGLGAVPTFIPFQEPENQVQEVTAGLLDGGLGQLGDAGEAGLEDLGIVGGLDLQVLVLREPCPGRRRR